MERVGGENAAFFANLDIYLHIPPPHFTPILSPSPPPLPLKRPIQSKQAPHNGKKKINTKMRGGKRGREGAGRRAKFN